MPAMAACRPFLVGASAQLAEPAVSVLCHTVSFLRDAYFAARLQTADRLIDSESGHWPVIAEVLRAYGAGGLSDIEGE